MLVYTHTFADIAIIHTRAHSHIHRHSAVPKLTLSLLTSFYYILVLSRSAEFYGFQYLVEILDTIPSMGSMGSCQASNPREYGTDKVKLANPTSMCADKTLAEDTGIVCDGPGVKVTSTGSTVYECCRGDLCNKDTKQALVNLQVPRDLCVHVCARVCAKMYACMHVCPWPRGGGAASPGVECLKVWRV